MGLGCVTLSERIPDGSSMSKRGENRSSELALILRQRKACVHTVFYLGPHRWFCAAAQWNFPKVVTAALQLRRHILQKKHIILHGRFRASLLNLHVEAAMDDGDGGTR